MDSTSLWTTSPISPLCRHQHKEYYYEGRQPAPDEVRYKQKGKFEPKVLVWVAISPRGRSRPVIFNSKLNVTAKVYQDKMIRPYLHPFLQEKYPTGGYVFWPDLARVHYAKSTVELLDELGILLLLLRSDQLNFSGHISSQGFMREDGRQKLRMS